MDSPHSSTKQLKDSINKVGNSSADKPQQSQQTSQSSAPKIRKMQNSKPDDLLGSIMKSMDSPRNTSNV